MYELWIENQEGVMKQADFGDDMPAMVYKANDIANLSTRDGNHSQRLRLPITGNNINIFGHSNDNDSAINYPYSYHKCILYSGGSVIAGSGSLLRLVSVTEYFECQIASGISDLFVAMEDALMSRLDLGYFDRNDQALNSSQYYLFAAATFIRGGADRIDKMRLDRTFPFVRLYTVVETMLAYHGFRFETNINAGNVLLNKAISLASINASDGSMLPLEGSARSALQDSQQYMLFTIINSGYNTLTADGRNLTYRMPDAGKVDFYVEINGEPDTRFELSIGIYSEPIITIPPSGSTSRVFTRSLQRNEGITTTLRITSNPSGTVPQVTIRIRNIQIDNSQVPMGGRVFIAPNIGYETHLQFFKMFIQAFGLTVYVDNNAKVVYGYTMDKIYENKSIAKDWSSKIHNGRNSERSFMINEYARKNIISFEDNSADDFTDSAEFYISNNTLKHSKELFKINLESGMNNLAAGNWIIGTAQPAETNVEVANIPLIDIADDGTVTFTGTKPHLVDILLDNILVSDDPRTDQYPRALHIRLQSLVDTYYNKLINNMLVAVKMIEEDFLLTDQDIQEFDPFIPVYLENYGAYFYVNKINNYISGRLTRCQLIRL